jgi:hypothetical protein
MGSAIDGLKMLVTIFKECPPVLESEEYFKVEIKDHVHRDILVRALIDIGYTDPCNIADSGPFYINLFDADCWRDGESPFVKNIGKFWEDVKQSLVIRDVFYLVDEEISSADLVMHEDISKIRLFLLWSSIFQGISDHKEKKSSSYYECIYFINNENQGKKYTVNLEASFEELKQLNGLPELHEVANEFLTYLAMKDAHAKERREVMRSALSVMLDEVKDGDNKIIQLINQGKRYFKKYEEQYLLYTQQFSVNKLLKEIDEKNIEYSSKVNDYISSSQTKALTMPGALIAIGAMMKSGSFAEYILILVGLYLIRSMILTANDIQQEAFDNLKKQLARSMNKYKKITQEAEVREAANVSLAEVVTLIQRAEKRLETISNWTNWMLFGGVAYIVFQVFLGQHVNCILSQVYIVFASVIEVVLTYLYEKCTGAFLLSCSARAFRWFVCAV